MIGKLFRPKSRRRPVESVLVGFERAGLDTHNLRTLPHFDGSIAEDGGSYVQREFEDDVRPSGDGKVIRGHYYTQPRVLGKDGKFHNFGREKRQYFEIPATQIRC